MMSPRQREEYLAKIREEEARRSEYSRRIVQRAEEQFTAAEAKRVRRNEEFMDKIENHIFRLWPSRTLVYRNWEGHWIIAFWWRGNARFFRLRDRRFV
jgi:hypothetical protein